MIRIFQKVIEEIFIYIWKKTVNTYRMELEWKKKKEIKLEELCKNCDPCFLEFMNYCRGLAFTQDPDYEYIISLFKGCMKNNGVDTSNPDFIWNKNRLAMEKEAIKRQ